MEVGGHVLEFLRGYRCRFEYHRPVVVPGSDLGPIRRDVESRYLGRLSRRVKIKSEDSISNRLWRPTIRGFRSILGEGYVLFGTTTLVFVILSCGQETK